MTGSLLEAVLDEKNYELRKSLLMMLRPLDILALIKARAVVITPIERKRYIVLWRQFFFNMAWVNDLLMNNCTVTLIGSGLGALHKAIASMDENFDPTTVKIIVAISETYLTVPRPFSNRQDTLAAFDAITAWHEVPVVRDHSTTIPRRYYQINQSPDDVQICVVSLGQWTCVDLCHLWSSALSSQSLLASHVSRPTTTSIIWKTEWQMLRSATTKYAPTHMHYIIEPHCIDKYRPRIFAGPRGFCSIMVMRE